MSTRSEYKLRFNVYLFYVIAHTHIRNWRMAVCMVKFVDYDHEKCEMRMVEEKEEQVEKEL